MLNTEYTGYTRLYNQDAADFYADKSRFIQDAKENQYIFLEDQEIYKFQNGNFKRVEFQSIDDLKPRNIEQRAAADMMLDETTGVKLITGGFGTGKTLFLVTAAMKALEDGKFEKIIWVRNNVQVKDTENIGALPGDEYDKTLPWLMPFADHCGGLSGIQNLIDRGVLEVIPLGFIRGRSIKDAIVLSSESENLTKQHIQLLLGRIDSGSNLWLDADLKQRDKSIFEKSQGLETMVERLAGNKNFGYVHLVKSERSEIARMADLLDN